MIDEQKLIEDLNSGGVQFKIVAPENCSDTIKQIVSAYYSAVIDCIERQPKLTKENYEKLIEKLHEAHIPLPPMNGENAYLEIGYNAGLMKAIEIVKNFGENKKQTNFERIISKNIDEFVYWMFMSDTNCDSCVYKRMDCHKDPKMKCMEGMKEYLKSEVKE